jgi:hypothetical protein
MEGSIAPLGKDWLPSQRSGGAMRAAGRIAGITLGALTLVIVMSQVPAMIRHYRMP